MAGVVAISASDTSGVVHLIRTTIGASVSIVDASADVAVSLLEAGGNVTVAVTTIFVDALSLSSSVMDDAWRGIDLHNVLATRRVGRLLTQNISVALLWLRDSGPTQAGNATLRIAESMSVLANPSTPFAEFEDSFFDPRGQLVTWFARGRVFETGATAMSFVVTETTFTPCWSNPVWAQMEYEVNIESNRILQMISSVASALPPTHSDALALPHPGQLFQSSSPFWSRIFYGVVCGATASAVCIACAYATESGRSGLQKCWEFCSQFFWSDVAADDEAVAPEDSVAAEFVIVRGGTDVSAVKPAADAASSQERMGTPRHDRAKREAN